MLGRRSDLPLGRDPSTRLLPWLIGVMVFLATLMLASGLLLSGTAAEWSRGLENTLTVQVPPLEDEAETDAALRVEEAVRVIRRTPGVAEAMQIPPIRVAAMLEPWLGPDIPIVDLPLPRLIDVRIENGADPDLADLADRLRTAVPGAALDSHNLWQEQLVKLLRSLELLAVGAIVLMALAAISVVVFATRSGLAVHREVIELLHLIGARDSYIARQFQRHALRLALKGSLVGAAGAAGVLVALQRMASGLDAALLPALKLQVWHWAVLAALPFAAALIAMYAARRTVVRALKRMV